MRSAIHKLFLAILAAASAVEAGHVLHEARDRAPRGQWRAAERVQPDSIIPLRIGLRQHNLDAGADRLAAISSPESKHYGKHMTEEEVHDMFAPSYETVNSVIDWLLGHGIDRSRIAHSDNKGWIAANIPAADFEKLFQSELYEYESAKTDKLKLGCDKYHIPEHLVEHIDYVTPGVKLSASLKRNKAKRSTNARAGSTSKKSPKTLVTSSGSWQPWGPPSSNPSIPDDVKSCSYNITPPCWRYLYNIPVNTIKDNVNDLGLFEQGDFFAQSDISSYFSTYSPNVPANYAPKVIGIDGGTAPYPANDTDLVTGESDIDLSITISLVYPQDVIVYQVDDTPTAVNEVAKDNLFNTFLDALDGSYCNYTAYGITGNSPGIDPTYPDTTNPGGYTGQLQCGTVKPARVISASYGESEYDLPVNYVRRQCNEFLKLGLQGHTILVSSSDFGVGEEPGDPDTAGCLSGNGQVDTIYTPDYPSGCPWITSVGATMLYPGQDVTVPESAMQVNLSGPGRPPGYGFFASAGGFSNYFKPAFYQAPTIAEYFTFHNPPQKYYVANDGATNIGENGGVYNRAGRGYPDIAANGAYMPTFAGGELGTYFGTSLAAPIWASVITLVNQQRTRIGKGPVGFINPVLYSNPWTLNDITNGSNPNCGGPGFKAVKGWDPVTGLGTPNYELLKDLWLLLP